MAHAALPLTKLISLLVKTVAKPASKSLKHYLSQVEVTKNLLIGVGQTSHVITSRMQIWSAGYKVRSIKPLDTEKALQLGSELLSEGFVFSVGAGLVIWEYNRSNEKSQKKEAEKLEKQKAENAALQAKLHSLDLRLIAVENVVKENSKSILNIAMKRPIYVEPPSSELVPIVDDGVEGRDPGETREDNIRVQTVETSSTNKISWWKVW